MRVEEEGGGWWVSELEEEGSMGFDGRSMEPLERVEEDIEERLRRVEGVVGSS